MKLNEFWAKSDPRMSLETHSIMAGIVAQILFQEVLAIGIKEQICSLMGECYQTVCRFIGYLSSVHDIGKLDYHFQAEDTQIREKMIKDDLRPRDTRIRPYRHEITGSKILLDYWKNCGCDRRLSRFYAGIIGAHHQGKQGKGSDNTAIMSEFHKELESKMRQYFLQTNSVTLPKVEKENQGTVGAILLGIVILSDWIVSSDYFSDAEEWHREEKLEETTKEKARFFLHASGLQRQMRVFGNTFCEVWTGIPSEGMRPLQKEIEKLFYDISEPISMVLIEAPMGEGKTEAGCYAAVQMGKRFGKHGIYFALPTTATSNQMVGRMRTWLKDDVRLLNSMSWLTEESIYDTEFQVSDEKEADVYRWLMPTRRGLLSSYAVGTVDQVMMAAMNIKYGVLRLFGLSGKVLLIDELHAYDVYMSEILKNLLVWCKHLEIPVVLLSATLPPEKKHEMLSCYTDEKIEGQYPAITAIKQNGSACIYPIHKTTRAQKVKTQLLPILGDEKLIGQKAMELVRDGGCICVLLNTVDQTQRVYSYLKDSSKDTELLLFHSRFTVERREQIEKQCVRMFGKDKTYRPKRAVLVATQVVEQSLDVDFDILMTSAAPIDLVLQRIGRLFRHDDTPRPRSIVEPVCYIFAPEEMENTSKDAWEKLRDGYVYPPCLLRQSIRLLKQKNYICIPEDMQQLVADGYDMENIPAEEMEEWYETAFGDQVKVTGAQKYNLNSPEKGYDPIITNADTVFDDLETNSYLSAKTRLGTPSVRIAMLADEEYQKAKNYLDQKKKIPMWLAKQIIRQSAAIPEKKARPFLSDAKALKGTGRLYGVYILPSDGSRFMSEENEIIFDDEFGVMFR